MTCVRGLIAVSLCAAAAVAVSATRAHEDATVTIHVAAERPRPLPPASATAPQSKEVAADPLSETDLAPLPAGIRLAKEIPASSFAPWVLETGLSSADFEIVANSSLAPVLACQPDLGPVTIVLIVDASRSMDNTVPAAWLPDLTRRVFSRTAQGKDRVAIGRVGRGAVRFSPGFSADVAALTATARDLLRPTDEDKASLVAGFEPSPLWDAIDEGIAMLKNLPGRRAIVVFSDGRSTANQRGLADMTIHAVAAGVSVNVVSTAIEESIRQSGMTSARIRPGIFLEGAATATGGTFIQAWQPAVFGRTRVPANDNVIKRSIGNVLTRMIDELHGGYTLSFGSPITDGQLHQLKVRVTKPGLRIRAPTGYRAPRAGSEDPGCTKP